MGTAVDPASVSFSFREPEPPPPLPAAAELLAEIRERGGRLYRMRAARVCCLTDSAEVAAWLLSLGAKAAYRSRGLENYPDGAYYTTRDRDKISWDLWIQTIPTEDSLWEALA